MEADAWREAFEAIPDAEGQLVIFAPELSLEADTSTPAERLAQVERRAREAANESGA